MHHPISFEFLERILAECPPFHVTVIAYGRKMRELVKVEYGTLYIRDATNFELNEGEPEETLDTNVTGYWYLPREKYVEEKKQEEV